MTSLSFAGVSVAYEKATAVHPFTDTVRPGEWLCLIGPNGAGKSSLLRSVAGLVKYSGQILIDGTPLDLRSTRRRASLVAHVPQAPSIRNTLLPPPYDTGGSMQISTVTTQLILTGLVRGRAEGLGARRQDQQGRGEEDRASEQGVSHGAICPSAGRRGK